MTTNTSGSSARTASLDEFRASFRFTIEHEVEFREIDVLAHVNNVRYVEWAENIRCKFFADVIGDEITGKTGAILAKHELEYFNMVRYREIVIIGGRITRWGNKSLDFRTEVWSEVQSCCVFRSTAVLVAYDYSAGTSIVVPEAWRRRVESS